MSLRFLSKTELAALLMVSEEDFHRKVKKLVKSDFKSELKMEGITNPDILLDDNNNIFLADPSNHNKIIPTNLSIFAYRYENE